LRKDNKTLVEVMATENAWSAETSEPFQIIDAKKSLVSNKRSHYIAPEVMLLEKHAIANSISSASTTPTQTPVQFHLNLIEECMLGINTRIS